MASNPEIPFPVEQDVAAPGVDDGVVAGAAARVKEVATTARERLADATVQAQDRAEAFRDSAAGYIQCYPFRSVMVAGALGLLAGLLAARLPR